jgi:hypothetical protein
LWKAGFDEPPYITFNSLCAAWAAFNNALKKN